MFPSVRLAFPSVRTALPCAMAPRNPLRPALRLKMDELFLRFLSDPDVQRALRDGLRRIADPEEDHAADRGHYTPVVCGTGSGDATGNAAYITPDVPRSRLRLTAGSPRPQRSSRRRAVSVQTAPRWGRSLGN